MSLGDPIFCWKLIMDFKGPMGIEKAYHLSAMTYLGG